MVFIKASNIKLRRNPSSGSRVDMCKQMDGQADRGRDIQSW